MILLIGAGAVGSVLAAHLAKAGREPLALCARDKDAEAFKAAGQLRLSYSAPGRQGFTAPLPPLARTLDLTAVEYLILCVKFGALEGLLAQLPPIPRDCTMVSTLNGIRALPLIRARKPEARVLPLTIMFNAQLPETLHGQLTTKPIVIVGGDDPRLMRAFEGTPMRVQRGAGEATVWGKLLINLANAVCAVTHTTFRDLFTVPALRRVYVGVLDEAIGLLNRTGTAFELPMPVSYNTYRWMLLKAGPLPWWIAKLKNDIQTGAYPSMVSDVAQGRLTEVDQLNGEIVALGQRHGLPTPVNAKLVELVQSFAGRKSPPLLTPEDLAKALRV